jgi:hypothetical protein
MLNLGVFELLIILVILGGLVGGVVILVRVLGGPRDPPGR